MSDAITYQHDDEARRSTLTLNTNEYGVGASRDSNGRLVITFTDDEAIALYELLRAQWAGYVAERDEAAAAVRAGVPLATFLDGWKTDTVAQYLDCPDESFGAYVDSADLHRDMERGK